MAPGGALRGARGPASNPTTLIIACGALVREIHAVIAANGLHHLDVRALPATWHNRPERIVPGIRRLLTAARAGGRYHNIFIAYADCGTGGDLDRLIAEEHLDRLPGAHCYAFYSGVDAFEAAAGADHDMRSFFLTDFLARQFDSLVIESLGLDRHPELREIYFQHYERVVYLSQTHDAALLDKARGAAQRLGLAFEHRHVGYGDLEQRIKTVR